MRLLPDVFISDVIQPGLAHLNILILAEFSLLSFFFFTAQHSEPCVIAGLMIVLKTFSIPPSIVDLDVHMLLLLTVNVLHSGVLHVPWYNVVTT